MDGRGRESVSAALEGLELVGDGRTLDTGAILSRYPEVVCIDDLAVNGRFAGARRLAAAGITVVATVHLASLRSASFTETTPYGGDAPPGGDTLDEAAVLALADELEMVDAAPSALIERVRRGEITPEPRIEHALVTDYAPQTLTAMRERAFRLLVEHANRASYQGKESTGSEEQPCILACASPRPGMEPLIRRSAALAAQLAGDFLVAVVAPSPPPDGLPELLAGYEALTTRLGGQLTLLDGPAAVDPAAALAAFARQHKVTEMLLARGANPPTGRRPVLRDLSRGRAVAEVHVLPAG